VPAALAAAEQQAQEMGQAFVDGNVEKLLDRTHAKVLELGGGRDKVRKLIQDGVTEMKAKGQGFHSMSVSRPQKIVRSKGNLYTIVPEHLLMKTPQGMLRSESFLVGVSGDNGRTWTFIDGAGTGNGQLEKVLPDFPKELQLPKLTMPQLIEDD
jgi:hypothetical protein